VSVHEPVRTCVGCAARAPQRELRRFVAAAGGLRLDRPGISIPQRRIYRSPTALGDAADHALCGSSCTGLTIARLAGFVGREVRRFALRLAQALSDLLGQHVIRCGGGRGHVGGNGGQRLPHHCLGLLALAGAL